MVWPTLGSRTAEETERAKLTKQQRQSRHVSRSGHVVHYDVSTFSGDDGTLAVHTAVDAVASSLYGH